MKFIAFHTVSSNQIFAALAASPLRPPAAVRTKLPFVFCNLTSPARHKRVTYLDFRGKHSGMASVNLYLLTEKTIVRMTREMTFERVPCVGEFLRIDAGGLVPQVVTEVVHDTDGSSRVFLGVTRNPEGNIDFWETETDMADDVSELQNAGWVLASKKPNTAWKK